MLGIQSIKPKTMGIFEYYEVKFDNQRVHIINELKNIRYDINDFRGKENEKLRQLPEKGDSMDNLVEALRQGSKKLRDSLHSKYQQI